MLQEVFVTLAAGAQHVGAPEEHVARPVRRIIRIETGWLEIARTRAVRDHGRRIGAGFVDMAAQLVRDEFDMGGGGETTHPFGAGVKVDYAERKNTRLTLSHLCESSLPNSS